MCCFIRLSFGTVVDLLYGCYFNRVATRVPAFRSKFLSIILWPLAWSDIIPAGVVMCGYCLGGRLMPVGAPVRRRSCPPPPPPRSRPPALSRARHPVPRAASSRDVTRPSGRGRRDPRHLWPWLPVCPSAVTIAARCGPVSGRFCPYTDARPD